MATVTKLPAIMFMLEVAPRGSSRRQLVGCWFAIVAAITTWRRELSARHQLHGNARAADARSAVLLGRGAPTVRHPAPESAVADDDQRVLSRKIIGR